MPTIDNPEIKKWYKDQNARNAARDGQTLILVLAYVIQLAVYYNFWSDAVDRRDDGIDRQKDLLDYLYDKDMTVDYPMMQYKQGVLGLSVPGPDLCGDALLLQACTKADGRVVDDLAMTQKAHSCGIPANWDIGEGTLIAARALAYTGGILANSGKRREEQFREEKTKLVLRAQLTARFSVGPILKDYQQAIAIQEGLASIFAAGFNSAGVGLGTALGQLANQNNITGTT